MNFLKAKIFISIVKLGFLCLCFTVTAPAADAPIFQPGKEYHVITDNADIGTKSFNLYVPLDYTEERAWPVIFRYKGRGEKYSPIICRGGRMITCDRGAIIIGMGYLEYDKREMTPAQFIDYIDRELKSIYEAKELVAKHLKVDNDRLFISGSSAGGWLASLLLKYRAQFWQGALIFVAGLHPKASILTNPDSVRALVGMPVFFGSSLPGTSHGGNYKWAKIAEKIYKQRGAVITSEIYREQWLVCSPLLRDWTRTFILDGNTYTTHEKLAKSRQLTRAKPQQIISTKIIKAQIAKQLNKQADRLTDNDLHEIKELSLVGENVSNIKYLTNLANLESLDISFTYVDNTEHLIKCRNLRKLNISGTLIKDITPLKDLRHLESLSMWNLWLDREQVNKLKQNLPNLKIINYQWDIYETDSIGRVLPKLRVTLK